ncbi:hypothetical protein [Endothiovibrio diazotrophicus]
MSEEYRFTSAAAALETFRRGARNARWHAAAEYLMRNASNDTQMLLDYAIERTRGEQAPPPKRMRGPRRAWLVAAVIGGAALVIAFLWLAAILLSELKCA